MTDGGMKVMEISDFNAVRGCPWPEFLKESGPAYGSNQTADRPVTLSLPQHYRDDQLRQCQSLPIFDTKRAFLQSES